MIVVVLLPSGPLSVPSEHPEKAYEVLLAVDRCEFFFFVARLLLQLFFVARNLLPSSSQHLLFS